MKNRPEVIRKLYHPKFQNDVVIAEIKNNSGSIAQFKQEIRPALQHPFTKSVFKNNLFPKSLDEIKKSKPLPSTNSLAGEAGWILHSILENKQQLLLFIELKNQFENYFLLEDYVKCEQILNQIENDISLSFWSIEARFILKEYMHGAESNWDLLSEYSKGTKDALVLFLIENFSKKVEQKVSFIGFRDLFVNKLEGLNAPNLVEYFCFRLSYSSYEGYQNFPFFLAVESNSSLIDRYLMLTDILFEGLKNNKSENISVFKEILDELSCFYNDLRLIQMKSLLNREYDKDFSTKSISIIKLFDLYTKGEFNHCLTNAIDLIKSNPSSIELFEIYSKSLIYLNRNFEKTNISTTIDDILENLFNLYSFDSNHQDSIGKLFKYSLSFQNYSWGRQLLGIATKYSSPSQNEKTYEYLFNLNSKHANPRLIELVDNPKESFNNSFENSIAFDSIKNMLIGNELFFENNVTIDKNKKTIYHARALFNLNRFSDLIELLERHSPKLIFSKIDIEEQVQLLFNSNLKRNNLNEALRIFVFESLNNKHLTSRLDSNELYNKAQQDSELNKMIEFPIFLKMYGANSYEQYVAYDNYLIFKGVNKPSEIIESNKINHENYLYFLSEVCRIDVMQYSLEYEGIDDVEAERQVLLSILVKEDRKNEDEYIKEITELIQGSKVRKAIQEVNKGRITVNISQLRNIESSNVEEGFLRYKELSRYIEKNIDAVGLDVSTKSIQKYIESLLEEKRLNQNNLTNNPAFISFKSMFLDLRDKFLLSKEYGLDGYLSTRIRHGTLENHIRSVFEKYSLIADRDKDGIYKSIEFWSEKLPLSNTQSETIQNLLKKFSEKVDNLVQFLIKEQIQIYTDKYNLKTKALFNFNFSHEYLWIIFQFVRDNISDHDTFIDYTFSELQAYTETRLEEIRGYFKNDLTSYLMKELDELQESLNSSLVNSFPELNASILSCRTEIQSELTKISDWFYLSNPTTNSISDVETTLRTSVEITNSITPNHQIDATYYGKLDLPIYGALHIIYISRILLDNIIKHSGLMTEKIDVEIGAELPNENTLRLEFSNKLADNIDCTYLEKLLKDVKQKWESKENFDMTNQEGGSGFDKIRRILAFDLKGANYNFDYKMNNKKLTVSIDVAIRIESHEEA